MEIYIVSGKVLCSKSIWIIETREDGSHHLVGFKCENTGQECKYEGKYPFECPNFIGKKKEE